jgi:hypothetical protein
MAGYYAEPKRSLSGAGRRSPEQPSADPAVTAWAPVLKACIRCKAGLALLAFLALPAFGQGYSYWGSWNNNLQQIAVGVLFYIDVYHELPTDIVDTNGRPLLSWRVKLLPFLEQDLLYREFHLNEPWDSPHNQKLLDKIPWVYTCPYAEPADRLRAFFALPQGQGTLFSPGGQLRLRSLNDIRPTTIILVELGAQDAVLWTKPGDFPGDAVKLRTDFADQKKFGFGRQARLVATADAKIRQLPMDVDEGLLRAMFSADSPDEPLLEQLWYEALRKPGLAVRIVPCFLISLLAIVGSILVVFRVVLRRSVTPGELLCLILGVAQVVFLFSFTSTYRYEPVPPSYRDQHQVTLWLLPRLGAAVVSLLALLVCWNRPGWRGLFLTAFVLFSLVTGDAWSPHQYRWPEESLHTMAGPIVLAMLCTGAVYLTFSLGIPQRRLAHWSGIIICLLPMVWFVLSCSFGWAAFRAPFERIWD